MDVATPTTMTPLDVPPSVPISYAVFDGLRAIQSTQYEHSFAARIYGHTPPRTPGLIAVDWGHSSWMTFTLTIRLHSQSTHLCIWVCVHITMLTLSFSSPERDQPEQLHTPITYVSLRPSHLPQVHDLLERVFGDGIDGKHALLPFFSSDPTADHILTPVSDALHYAPERSTVITMYDHLVVGAAFLSSPQETYITYLVVRAGWENAQIATYFTFFFRCRRLGLSSILAEQCYTILLRSIHIGTLPSTFLRITRRWCVIACPRSFFANVHTDDGQLLYNRFGFKAEESIAWFYEAYLDTHARASKNAFRLRLRR